MESKAILVILVVLFISGGSGDGNNDRNQEGQGKDHDDVNKLIETFRTSVTNKDLEQPKKDAILGHLDTFKKSLSETAQEAKGDDCNTEAKSVKINSGIDLIAAIADAGLPANLEFVGWLRGYLESIVNLGIESIEQQADLTPAQKNVGKRILDSMKSDLENLKENLSNDVIRSLNGHKKQANSMYQLYNRSHSAKRSNT